MAVGHRLEGLITRAAVPPGKISVSPSASSRGPGLISTTPSQRESSSSSSRSATSRGVGGIDDVQLQLGARKAHGAAQRDERKTGGVAGHGRMIARSAGDGLAKDAGRPACRLPVKLTWERIDSRSWTSQSRPTRGARSVLTDPQTPPPWEVQLPPKVRYQVQSLCENARGSRCRRPRGRAGVPPAAEGVFARRE